MDDDIRQRLDAREFHDAFGLLVERFQHKVFRLAFSILRNEAHAQDAAQNVFVRIWKGLPSYNGGASLSTWVYTITRNTCLSELKKSLARPAVFLSEPGVQAAAEDFVALDTHQPGTELDIAAALAELPERYRQVVTLFYLEDRAYEEVAAMLGIPLGTVKTLLFRAKKELLRIGSRQARVCNPPKSQPVERGKPIRPAPVYTQIKCAALKPNPS